MASTFEVLDNLEVLRVAVDEVDPAAVLAAAELEGEGLAGGDVEVGVEELRLGHGDSGRGGEDSNGGLHFEVGCLWLCLCLCWVQVGAAGEEAGSVDVWESRAEREMTGVKYCRMGAGLLWSSGQCLVWFGLVCMDSWRQVLASASEK